MKASDRSVRPSVSSVSGLPAMLRRPCVVRAVPLIHRQRANVSRFAETRFQKSPAADRIRTAADGGADERIVPSAASFRRAVTMGDLDGGGGWIRTNVGEANGFTVRPL